MNNLLPNISVDNFLFLSNISIDKKSKLLIWIGFPFCSFHYWNWKIAYRTHAKSMKRLKFRRRGWVRRNWTDRGGGGGGKKWEEGWKYWRVGAPMAINQGRVPRYDPPKLVLIPERLGGKRRPMVVRRASPFGMPFGKDTTTVSGNRETWKRSICIRREIRAVNFFPRRGRSRDLISGRGCTSPTRTSPRITLRFPDFSPSLSRLINGISAERCRRE